MEPAMAENIFEIRDDDIDVKEIRRKLLENLQKRMDSGNYPPPVLPDETRPSEKITDTWTSADLSGEYSFINANWDIHNTRYTITSHRPFFGRFLVRGRQLVHGEIRRYIDPIISMQTRFNESAVRILNSNAQKIESLNENIRNSLHELTSDIRNLNVNILDDISQKNQLLEMRLQEQNAALTALLNEVSQKTKLLEMHTQEQNAALTALQNEISQKNQLLEKELMEQKLLMEKVQDENQKSIDERVHQAKIEVMSEVELRSVLQQDKLAKDLPVLINDRVNQVVLGIEEDIRSKSWLENILSESLSTTAKDISVRTSDGDEALLYDYYAFNQDIGKAWMKGSGDPIDKPNIFEEAMTLFSGCHNVLDIGCGQGYFLNLLKSNDIGSYGIDINKDYVLYCQRNGLNVQHIDAISHLKSIQDSSLDGIFINQVMEHLSPDSIFSLIQLCYQKLRNDTFLIISTPNILSVQVSSNLFYMDPSHKTHIHPDVMKFILRYNRFTITEEKFYQPVPADHKLRTILEEEIQENNMQFSTLFNYNVNLLNQFLFGCRDYAIIAKKWGTNAG